MSLRVYYLARMHEIINLLRDRQKIRHNNLRAIILPDPREPVVTNALISRIRGTDPNRKQI